MSSLTDRLGPRVPLMACVALLLAASPTHASEADLFGPWIGVGLGVGIGDSVQASEHSFERAETPTPVMALEAFMTTLRWDYGVLVHQVSGGSYERPNGIEGRLGSLLYAAPFLRWRYWITMGGSFTLKAAPAWVALIHSDYIRRDLAFTRDLDLEDVEPVTHSFGIALSTGFVWALRRDVALNFSLDTLIVDTNVKIGDDSMEVERVQTSLLLTLLWTL